MKIYSCYNYDNIFFIIININIFIYNNRRSDFCLNILIVIYEMILIYNYISFLYFYLT